jgi:hypothetical protein
MIELAMMIVMIPFAFLGSGIRVLWGMYKAYESYLGLRLSRSRIIMEFLLSMTFGIFGGAFLSEIGLLTIGVNFGCAVCSIMGPNVVDVIVKKFGFTKKMEVIVSDQQLGFTEFNHRQVNALTYAKGEGRITNAAYQRINQTDRDVARYELNGLVRKGRLKRVGKSKGAYYVSS